MQLRFAGNDLLENDYSQPNRLEPGVTYWVGHHMYFSSEHWGDFTHDHWGHQIGEFYPTQTIDDGTLMDTGHGSLGFSVHASSTNPGTHLLATATTRYSEYFNDPKRSQPSFGNYELVEIPMDQWVWFLIEVQFSTYDESLETGDFVSNADQADDGHLRMWITWDGRENGGIPVLERTNERFGFPMDTGPYYKWGIYSATYKNCRWGWGSRLNDNGLPNVSSYPEWWAEYDRTIFTTNFVFSLNPLTVADEPPLPGE